MIKSMTGFGRCEVQKENRKFTVELKSVNHRYLDVNIRMPKKLNFFETSIRTLLKSYASRGKVDIFITYEDASQSQVSVRYHAGIAGEYLKYLQQMETEFGLENDIRVSSLARFPEVFTMEEQAEDEDKLWNGLKEALEGAFRQFVETRTAEGENLKKDLLEKLSYLECQVGKVEERSPQIVAEYRAKLETRVKELLAEAAFDESRIVAEVSMFADKICVDEELVRLRSHIDATKAALKAGGNVGRKLDFIAQEMNREANTTLSKSNDIQISDCAIEIKTGIEKIREQIQNLE